jgi:hypothetical protein
MFASVRALLSGIIDYAGMFPPAKLPLEEAIRNYARYRTEPESWMLGRFICPAARLEELTPFLKELFQTGSPLQISALGRGGDTVADFVAGLHADLEIIGKFHKKCDYEKLAAVEVFEIRLPVEIVRSLQPAIEKLNTISELHLDVCRITQSVTRGNFPIFYELPCSQDWHQTIPAFTKENAIRKMNFPIRPCGIKIRCGGLEASAFPSPNQIASIITSCRDKCVPLKATAGLHHPIRHFDAGMQAHMNGFLNVFSAGVLAIANNLSEYEIQAIIEDLDPKNFVFDDDGLSWKEYRAKTSQIEAARREFITSFGSCSFDEPRDDLRAFGLIP